MAFFSAVTVVPWLDAMLESESPALTVWRPAVELEVDLVLDLVLAVLDLDFGLVLVMTSRSESDLEVFLACAADA